MEKMQLGIGISSDICNTLFNIGIDVVTSGNHIYKKREIYDYIAKQPRLSAELLLSSVLNRS